MSDGRRICPACGSNNFETQAACWKCGKPLTGAAAGPTPAAFPTSAPAERPSTGALWATIALGILFPLVAFPVGLVFLMFDEPRKSVLGRWNLLWSAIGLVVHVVGTVALAGLAMLPFRAILTDLTRMPSQMQRATDLDEGRRTLDGAFPSPR